MKAESVLVISHLFQGLFLSHSFLLNTQPATFHVHLVNPHLSMDALDATLEKYLIPEGASLPAVKATIMSPTQNA